MTDTQQEAQHNTQSKMELRPSSQGKVRDLYDLGDTLLIVASDRISAFDYILPDEIPYKGEILTQMSIFWFDLLKDVVPNHFISADLADLPEQFRPYQDYLAGRFMLVKKAKMLSIECIVRGYLTGSALGSYKKNGQVCGQALPDGLVESSKLETAIYTPSTKAELGEHDENISFEKSIEILGEHPATNARVVSLEVYKKASEYASEHGIIIADTKFEFGMIDGKFCIADEVLTPDSSRFWPKSEYECGKVQPSFDKQYVRNWLNDNWDRNAGVRHIDDCNEDAGRAGVRHDKDCNDDSQAGVPHLPKEVIKATSEKYVQAYEMLTNKKFEPKSRV